MKNAIGILLVFFFIIGWSGCTERITKEEKIAVVVEEWRELSAFPPTGTILGHGFISRPEIGRAYYDFNESKSSLIIHKEGVLIKETTFSDTYIRENNNRVFIK